ncbi:hypothetical protein CPAR01_08573 [Colletotrichum paranaense]|uniref:Uncharacterized protein n=1 Tax=Colletotrichum paranaense TaxID=1914294 RepID=A0ABQ9SKR5_9PEZI|nr:uncharacterized protein CPAR01_08573 [Colletotrichum paranaense]KAK1538460.1 hypothetical protein CPAR01_08573 [Colletotrichum paranaense]
MQFPLSFRINRWSFFFPYTLSEISSGCRVCESAIAPGKDLKSQQQEGTVDSSCQPFLVVRVRDPLSPLHPPILMADGSGRWHGGVSVCCWQEAKRRGPEGVGVGEGGGGGRSRRREETDRQTDTQAPRMGGGGVE